MDKQKVIFRDLGKMEYKEAWDYQEKLLQENARRKSAVYSQQSTIGSHQSVINNQQKETADCELQTEHYLLFVEHPPVYTLGKSGSIENVLLSEEQLEQNGIQF